MSFPVVLSESEREHILGGVKIGVRADGRGCKHVRHFSLKTGVVSNTSGSALIERVSAHTPTHISGLTRPFFSRKGPVPLLVSRRSLTNHTPPRLMRGDWSSMWTGEDILSGKQTFPSTAGWGWVIPHSWPGLPVIPHHLVQLHSLGQASNLGITLIKPPYFQNTSNHSIL